MAQRGYSISLSQMSPTSDDDSSDQNIPNILLGGATGGSSSQRRPPISAAPNHLPPPPKKPRGRPPGSKNKPKPPVVITQESEDSLKPVVIEVAAGADVVEALVNFARSRHVGISVLSGSGTISNVTLRHPLPHAPAFTLHGPFTILSLTGTFLSCPSPPPPPLPSSSLFNPNYPVGCNSFGISMSGSQGQIFGGVIAGRVVAGSLVVVVVTMFKNPEFHKVGFNENAEGGGGGGGGGDGDNNPSGSGDRGGGIGNDNMSGFNVGNIPTQLNSPVPSADVNMMPWGHIYPCNRPANY